MAIPSIGYTANTVNSYAETKTSTSGINTDTQKHPNDLKSHKQEPNPHQEAVKISISDEAKQLYKKRELGKLTPVQDELSFKAPEKGSIERVARDELAVKEVLREGTAEHFIFNALNGKVENAYEFAQQLGNLIFSHDTDKDVEARAIDRETGKKLAEYIAQNYLDDPTEAQSFMDGINKTAEKSEMRDKGYTVIIGSNIEPFKPQANDFLRYAEEHLGYTSDDWNDSAKRESAASAFMRDVISFTQKNDTSSKYSQENVSSLANYSKTLTMYSKENEALDKLFDENEKTVQSIIDKAKASIGGIAVNSNFFDSMSKVLSSLNPTGAANLSNILGLLASK